MLGGFYYCNVLIDSLFCEIIAAYAQGGNAMSIITMNIKDYEQ